MDKNQTIAFVQEQIARGVISQADIAGLVHVSQDDGSHGEAVHASSNNLIKIFYSIGALIAVIGVCILVGQNWKEIGVAGRLLVTLGIALTSYSVAMVLRTDGQKMISQALFTVSAALAPLASYVLIHESGARFDLPVQTVTALVLTALFLFAWYVSRRNILVVATIGYATWMYYAGLLYILNENRSVLAEDYLKLATIILGVVYILIAYVVAQYASSVRMTDLADAEEKQRVAGALYGFGTLGVLGAGIMVGGIFDLVFILVLFAGFYGSVYLKSRAMLIFAALFLMGHIIKLSTEYFANSIGWSVSLIFVGFCVIGIGYMTYTINQKYIKGK